MGDIGALYADALTTCALLEPIAQGDIPRATQRVALRHRSDRRDCGQNALPPPCGSMRYRRRARTSRVGRKRSRTSAGGGVNGSPAQLRELGLGYLTRTGPRHLSAGEFATLLRLARN